MLPADPGFCVQLATLPNIYGVASTLASYSGFAYVPDVDALIFGCDGGHAATPCDAPHRFPFATFAWETDYQPTPTTQMTAANWRAGNVWEPPGAVPPIRPVARHSYDGNIWSPECGELIVNAGNNAVGNTPPIPYNLTAGGNRAHYNPVAKTWRLSTVAGTHNGTHCRDPISGNILSFDEIPSVGFRWRVYDPRTMALLVTLDPRNGAYFADGVYRSGTFGYTTSLTYHPPSDTFIYINRSSAAFELKLDRATWKPLLRKLVVPVVPPLSANHAFTYDSKNDLIVGGITGSKLYGLKRTGVGTGEWYSHPAAPATSNAQSWGMQYVASQDATFFTSIPVGSSDVRPRYLFALRWDPAQATLIPDPNLAKATITVGGQTVATLSAATAIGGAITLGPGGLYGADGVAQIDKPVSIVGEQTEVGKAALLNKGALIVNADAVLERLVLLGVKVPDMNGAGVRWQAGNLTLRNCTLQDNQNGILSGAGTGALLVEGCTVQRNGAGDGQSHGLYIGTATDVVIRNCSFADQRIGHDIKSRAAKTLIEDCQIGNFVGSESYNVDLPSGGEAVVRRCALRQGPKTDNSYLASYWAEQRNTHAANSVHFQDCTFESQGVNGVGFWNRHPEVVALVERCDFIGPFQTLVRGFHRLRDCKRNGVAIPDADVLPANSPPDTDCTVTIDKGDMYNITLRGTTGSDAEISKVLAKVVGGAAAEVVAGPNEEFTIVLQHPLPGSVTVGHAYADAQGNVSAYRTQSVDIPDMQSPAAPSTDLAVVSVVWVA